MTVTLAELTRTFARIGCLSFGGPAAQIALLHRVLVDEKRWIAEADYLRALSFCMLLPGPEAMQLATWSGWRLHGTPGGLIGGGLFVLPGALVVLALSVLYAGLGDVPLVAALFAGVQAAIVAIVIEALLRVSRRALTSGAMRIVAALSFLALFLLALPFPVIILAAALAGAMIAARQTAPAPSAAPSAPASLGALAGTVAAWAGLWLAPLIGLWLAGAALLAEIGAFFAKLALLTFGGAYALLVWMTQEVVEDKGWLTLPQMMDGLGLAETTPGPLILVTQFVGFMAGHGAGGWPMALGGALVALWATFIPSFLFIFAGAPWIDRLTGRPRLAGALAGISAAVVGVIANLSLWFALHVLFARQSEWRAGPVSLPLPDLSSLDPVAALIGVASAILLLRLHRPLWQVLLFAALAGVGLAPLTAG